MVSGVPGGITKGLNRKENHDKIVEYYERTAPVVANAGYKNIICFSGNREGMSDEQGLENCAIGLKRIVPICEKHKVIAAMQKLLRLQSRRCLRQLMSVVDVASP